MKSRTIVWKSLRFYWRTNLAILLGIVVGTAVIGGALIVGDSVRGSLRELTLRRLGKVDYAVTGGRFFREDLAERLSDDAEFQETYTSVAPVLSMTGSLERRQDNTVQSRAGGVSIFGIDERFWEMIDHGDGDCPVDDGVVLNRRVADQLQVAEGDRVSLWVELPTTIPRDSLLGEREEVSREIDLEIRRIVDDELGLSRFGLNPSQQIPLNAFVALRTLQQRLDLSEIRATPRRPNSRAARVNTLFVASGDEATDMESGQTAAAELTSKIALLLTPGDISVDIKVPADSSYVSIQSDQLILENAWELAVDDIVQQSELAGAPSLIYLANEFRNPEREPQKKAQIPGYSMYSMVAGLDLNELPAEFGSVEVIEGQIDGELANDEIVLNEWLASDLDLKVGDTLELSYYQVGNHGELPESMEEFRVRAIIALSGAAADVGIVPEVQGITDVKSIGDWKQPFPMQMQRVTDRDDDYWEIYRATPKAFVSLSRAQELWGSRYGRLTSYRVAGESLSGDQLQENVTSQFRTELTPDRTGIGFRAIKVEGLQAAVGANDFTGLFLAFSFFLIAAAAILIGLLFRLNVERRAGNVGLLSAVGVPARSVRGMLLNESLILAVAGSIIGCGAAIGYAAIMVHGLGTWWVGATGTTEIRLIIQPASVLGGAATTVLVTLGVVYLSLRRLGTISLRSLLLGGGDAMQQAVRGDGGLRRKMIWGSFGLAAVLLVAGLLRLLPDSEAFGGFSWQVVSFFVVGLSLLTGCLLLFSQSLLLTSSFRMNESLSRLAYQNARRNRQRSVLTCGLIAFACFVIVAVAAGHRNPAIEYPDVKSGNGGFLLVAESNQGILDDLNDPQSREDLGIAPESDLDAALLRSMHVEPFLMKPGEDSSCLNLYQTSMPTVLGAPQTLIERGGFRFADTPGDNPWQLLNEDLEDEDGLPVIPIVGDMNTLKYSLKLGIGDVIDGPETSNPEYRLKIVGMLDASIFQGVVVMADERFRELFPDDAAGERYFLVSAAPDVLVPGLRELNLTDLKAAREKLQQEVAESEEVSDENQKALDTLELQIAELQKPGAVAAVLSERLETGLNNYGFDLQEVSDRLANFLSVQNTYLSTFQTLAGLGLVLGTFGLATVMLRNVFERRSEIALLRSVGYRNGMIGGLVLLENGLLLVWGVAAGTVAALIAMLPHLRSTGADVPWMNLAVLLALVFITGSVSALVAVREAVRTPIVATLRGD